jgi:hypothetical protein
MSIFYNKENKGWDLSQLTQDELDILLDFGRDEFLRTLGATMIKKLGEKFEQDNLADIDTAGGLQ